jgi:hypothetical protein
MGWDGWIRWDRGSDMVMEGEDRNPLSKEKMMKKKKVS